jgi:23S rRNA (cytosine1962-C5)-methyltransferase
MGQGFVNDNSKIRIRMMSRRKENPVTAELIAKRVKAAWNYRKSVYGFESDTLFHYQGTVSDSCRLIFGEADFLPGITIDKFGDVLVIESLALGTDRMKDLILSCCREVLAEDGITIRGIYERSDAKVRLKEGLPLTEGFLGPEFETKVEIRENDVRYLVDIAEGQKTGFFLDQKLNRKAIWPLCRGAKVLDCFTHTGSFALNAGKAGAREVLAVDASALAIRQAEENARLNGLQDTVRFQTADVFELLPELEKAGEQYDVVILDPPAFTKSRSSVKNAVKGYKEINLRGMKLVKNGGFLATCSCSHFMTPDLFSDTIKAAARDAHKILRQVEYRTQAPDHPFLWTAEESLYLKFFIFQVCERV